MGRGPLDRALLGERKRKKEGYAGSEAARESPGAGDELPVRVG